jgi:hypothetical protein
VDGPAVIDRRYKSAVVARCGSECILIDMEKIQVEHQGLIGLVWVAAWLFTIGFLHLTFWKGVLAILLWPYYLGVGFSR